MKLLGRSQLVAYAAVTIMAVGVGAALADTQHHNPPRQGGKHGFHGPCSPAQVARNKATVVAYYTTAFNQKKPEEAVAKYGGPVYIQHNPQAADGFHRHRRVAKSDIRSDGAAEQIGLLHHDAELLPDRAQIQVGEIRPVFIVIEFIVKETRLSDY